MLILNKFDPAGAETVIIMTSSNENIFCITGPFCREFTSEFSSKMPVMRSFDVFFDLHQNKQLSK